VSIGQTNSSLAGQDLVSVTMKSASLGSFLGRGKKKSGENKQFPP